jgi:hypothetical protein
MTTQSKNPEQNTQEVIDYFRNLPGEFYMLKGLLCVEHALTEDAKKNIEGLFNRLMIAERMDEISRNLD